MLIVHSNTFAPTPNPVTPLFGFDGVVIVPLPLTNVQTPVPTIGVFPDNVADVPQTVWFVPATDVVGPPVLVIVTCVLDDAQGALLIVHSNTFAPTPNPVTVVFGFPGVVIVPLPLTNVHTPVPTDGVFPANVALVEHRVWFVPAFDAVGAATPVIVT